MSRVRLTIRFPNLNKDGRIMLWRYAIDQLRAENNGEYVELHSSELERLAEIKLNGNEIQNAIRTARQLAADSGERWNSHHIEQTLRIMFDPKRLEELFGKSL